MTTLRRLLPSLAALLAVLVVVQTTDLVACADEALAAETGETHTDARLAQGGHDVPAPGDSHDEGEHEHEEGTFADCLCHVVFTPTGIVPAAGVRPASEPTEFAYVADAPPEVEPLGLDHVPLA
ncbi:hypothetical protein [Rubricoccus marinus]|uniref:Secreted protein n=1 Tax=Rubricoccus marinus TaxID=716817 RepID=A0A259TU31_9BACT|nr:hypothetical protein [Rubricoccus marinus]OZC01243.1 hypothetical protein BSZ36_18505 [Rubricoccus marinus]